MPGRAGRAVFGRDLFRGIGEAGVTKAHLILLQISSCSYAYGVCECMRHEIFSEGSYK